MKMVDALNSFPSQFDYKPVIENIKNLKVFKQVVLLGMGGSHLAGYILKTIDPLYPLTIHSDYGLPAAAEKFFKESLIVASSYSGNTEEIIDGFDEAVRKGYKVAVIASGGRLIDLAKALKLPYVLIPTTGIQPRAARGFSTMALLQLIGAKKLFEQASRLSKALDCKTASRKGRELANKIHGKIPVVYSSTRNASIAYIWKINFNETCKIPAFANVFPESNHNEINGFDVVVSTQNLIHNFCAVFFRDPKDRPRIHKRMEVVGKLYRDRGVSVEVVELHGENPFEKIFNSTYLSDWTGYHLALEYGADPNNVPIIEELKRMIA